MRWLPSKASIPVSPLPLATSGEVPLPRYHSPIRRKGGPRTSDTQPTSTKKREHIRQPKREGGRKVSKRNKRKRRREWLPWQRFPGTCQSMETSQFPSKRRKRAISSRGVSPISFSFPGKEKVLSAKRGKQRQQPMRPLTSNTEPPFAECTVCDS